MSPSRRHFLKSAALTTAVASISPTLLTPASTSSPAHFDFVFFTDTHIQPELDAAHGCDMAFRNHAAGDTTPNGCLPNSYVEISTIFII